MNATPAAQRSWQSVLPFLVGLACFALLAVLNHVRDFPLWRTYALSGVIMGGIVTWILWRWDVRIPHYIQWVVVGGMILHYGGGSLGTPDAFRMGLFGFHGINGAYHTFNWWDHLTHGAGIGAGTMATAYLLEIYQTRRGLQWSAPAVWLFSVVVGLAMGVGVELYEYLGKSAFQTIDQGGYENTMRDLHYNVLGAVIGGGIAALFDRRRLSRRIEEHWGTGRHVEREVGWLRRLPPSMAGLLAFVAPAAGMTVVLAVRFLLQDNPPADDAQAYEHALRSMLATAVVGAVLAPIAAVAWRRHLVAAEAT